MHDEMTQPSPPGRESWKTVATYHERTKHHFSRYARSLGYMDWATQPDPFRRFAGSELKHLPLAAADGTPLYDQLFELQPAPPRELNIESIGELFEHSLSVTAWKEFGKNRWALRANPSSGNLHPTEGYLVAPDIDGLGSQAAVYHYAPHEHGLERRTEFAADVWQRLIENFPPGSFLVGLSSIHWREAWKYGERAYRYCQHDVGHALACLRFAAASLGWRLRLLEDISDAAAAKLLGLDRDEDFPEPREREEPELMAVIYSGDRAIDPATLPRTLPTDAIEAVAAGLWTGHANRLSADHVHWEVIDQVARACVKPETQSPSAPVYDLPSISSAPPPRPRPITAAAIFRQRRSAVALDARTSISRDAFYAAMSRVTPHAARPPWDAIGWPPCVHLGLFVHRVDDLPPGLYALARTADAATALQQSMNPKFLWQRPDGCPQSLPLFLLEQGDVRRAATQASCQQEIAGDGAFSLGMLADWQQAANNFGPWFYKRLFWESGMIGQVLYLEAEAMGIRGTGMGCYFDEPVHDLFGLHGGRFQSMYHFTLGGPLEDQRITTLAAYPR